MKKRQMISSVSWYTTGLASESRTEAGRSSRAIYSSLPLRSEANPFSHLNSWPPIDLGTRWRASRLHEGIGRQAHPRLTCQLMKTNNRSNTSEVRAEQVTKDATTTVLPETIYLDRKSV